MHAHVGESISLLGTKLRYSVSMYTTQYTKHVACVAAVKSRPVLHHCVVIFFWSSGIMDCACMLFSFENGVPLMRQGASVVQHHSILLMNSFNKTEAAVFSCKLCFLGAFPFISSNILTTVKYYDELLPKVKNVSYVRKIWLLKIWKKYNNIFYAMIATRTLYARCVHAVSET